MLMTLVVAGIGFIGSRCFAMGQRAEQPKETPIALNLNFYFVLKKMQFSLDSK